MENMAVDCNNGSFIACNIATGGELLLNVAKFSGNATAKRSSTRRKWVVFSVYRYPLVHPGTCSTILICALSDR